MPIVGEVEMTLPTYRAILELRAAYIPFWCKVSGILLAVTGLLVLSWSDGYVATGLLLLAGVLMYFAVPAWILGRLTRSAFPHSAGVWRYEIDDDGVCWSVDSLRVSAGWSRIVLLEDHPDLLVLTLSGRTGEVPMPKAAFSEADRETLAGFCRDRIATRPR